MGKIKETTIQGTTAKGNTWQTTVRGSDEDVQAVRDAGAASGGGGGTVVRSAEIDD